MNYGTESRNIFLKGIEDNKFIPVEYKSELKELAARQFQILSQFIGTFELLVHREEAHCSNHKREIAGISDMKELANMIGDLHYETLAEFFFQFELKFKNDSEEDRSRKRYELAERLYTVSHHIGLAYQSIWTCWKISKPYMKSNNQ